jgi:hypothetical protein
MFIALQYINTLFLSSYKSFSHCEIKTVKNSCFICKVVYYVVMVVKQVMKDITMKIEILKSTTIRLILGSGESDTYYLHKGNKTGTWAVRQNGELLEFAPSKALAIKLAQTIHEGK